MNKGVCANCACRDHTGYCEMQMMDVYDHEYCHMFTEKEEPKAVTWAAVILTGILLVACMWMLEGCAAKPAPKPTEQVVLQVSDKPAPEYLTSRSTQANEEESAEADDAEAPVAEYTQPAQADYVEHGDGDKLTKSGGVNQYNGKTETWYSSNVLVHKDIDQWTAGADGVWRDSDGYIILASSDMPFGTVHETSLGEGKVYDSGCSEGVVDIYVNW